MNILIPTLLSTKRKVGVAEYLIHVVKYLQVLDKENSYYIVTSIENRKFFDLHKKNFKEIVIPIFDFSRVAYRLQYAIFHFFVIPILFKALKIDFMHMPCPWFAFKKIKTITTVHDLTEVAISKYNIFLNLIKKKIILSSIKNSRAIITVSDATKSQIENKYKRHCTRIYNGINEEKSNYDKSIITLPYQLKKKKYFISIGTLLHHKNFDILMKCFHLFSKISKDIKLVIVGNKDNAYQKLINLKNQLQLGQNLIITGYLEDRVKNHLLKNSLTLISISKNEGFGMTLLEAQNYNIPIIASCLDVYKEILNDSAVFVNYNNFEEVANTMSQLVRDEFLRKSLIQKGRQNLKRFSWETSTKEILSFYNSMSIS